MPTYEYECTACGQHVEVFQRFSEAPLTTCGVCGGPLRKVFHPAGIVFKGSGFYATDSRSSSARRSGPSGEKDGGTASPSPGGDGAGGSKGDAGSAAATEAGAS